MANSHLDAVWVNALLQAVANCSPEGAAAATYLRSHRTKIGFQRVRANVGALWTPLGNIRLNSRYYSSETPLTDPGLLGLIIHETRHLQHGPVIALSVYGELEAWQLDFRVRRRVMQSELPAVILELMSLPLGWDRHVLRTAQGLMRSYAGKGYRADLLPLYPIHQELIYRVCGKVPASNA